MKPRKFMDVTEAGRLGGLRTLETRGVHHFSVIGRRGQEVMRARHPGQASEWGKHGGRPKKPAQTPMGTLKDGKENADSP
ncbi:hypothetical protein Dform_00818 [Dehalogenimonas formicexedens]|uniref:Uncharacterized protein n=1 Tax=Dehalogenimonas formicexedens TaxID=1839801 RepID=A0A1P8F6Q5_9CHLR|nr:hypothetical protein Dform_00818 [Dehalogenimonas formicexedens]